MLAVTDADPKPQSLQQLKQRLRKAWTSISPDDTGALLIYCLEAKDDLPNIHRTQAPKNTPGSHEMGPSTAAASCLQQAHTVRTHQGECRQC